MLSPGLSSSLSLLRPAAPVVPPRSGAFRCPARPAGPPGGPLCGAIDPAASHGICPQQAVLGHDLLEVLKGPADVEMVLLGPTVTADGGVTARQLDRLVKTATRPVITIARQSAA